MHDLAASFPRCSCATACNAPAPGTHWLDLAHRASSTSWPTGKIRAETNAGHEMIERHDLFFLKPNAAWQADPAAPKANPGEVHEIILQQIAPGQNPAVNAFLRSTWLAALQEAGARNLGIFDMASGYGMPQLVIFNAWPDAAAWQRGRTAMDYTGPLQQDFAAQRNKLGQPLFGRSEVNLLAPVPGVLIHPALGRSSTQD